MREAQGNLRCSLVHFPLSPGPPFCKLLLTSLEWNSLRAWGASRGDDCCSGAGRSLADANRKCACLFVCLFCRTILEVVVARLLCLSQLARCFQCGYGNVNCRSTSLPGSSSAEVEMESASSVDWCSDQESLTANANRKGAWDFSWCSIFIYSAEYSIFIYITDYSSALL